MEQFDLRWWLLSSLVEVTRLQLYYRLFVVFSFSGFAVFSLLPTFFSRIRKHRFTESLSSDTFFIFFVVFFIVASRWPGLFPGGGVNPDEAQWIAGAMKLLHDPVFWRSVDGNTSGPLNIFPLVLPALFGLRLEYASARLIGLILITLSSLWLYFSLKILYGFRVARLSVMPVVTCIALMRGLDFIHYSSEHVPVALVSLSLFLLCKYYSTVKNIFVLGFGFIIGLIPYAKFQAVPIAFALWVIFLCIIWSKRSSKVDFFRKLSLLSLVTIFFSVLVTIYLFVFSLWGDFWKSYILSDLIHQRGSGINFFSFFFTPMKLVYYTLEIMCEQDIQALLQLTALLLIAVVPFLCIFRWRENKRRPASLGFIAYCLFFLAASYYVTTPYKNPLFQDKWSHCPHYLLFLIIPCGFIIGVLLGELNLSLLAIRSSFRNRVLAFIIGVIVASCIMQVSGEVIEERNAFIEARRLFMGRYTGPAVEILRGHARTGECMAVWGWCAELYVDSGLIQATRDGHTFRHVCPGSKQPYYVERYAKDLLTSRPVLFVDAGACEGVIPRAPTFLDIELGDYKDFPEIASIIEKHYELVSTVQGIKIYAKK